MKLKNEMKLIGVDLDGTLLKDDKTLCAGTAEVIKRAAGKGIYFVPITGRPYSGIPDCLKNIEEIKYYICSNGAQIMDAQSGKSIFSFPLENKQVLNIINRLENTEYMFEVFADGVGYISPDLFAYYQKIYSGTPVGDYIFSSRKVTDNVRALFDGTDKTADEVFVICKSPAHRERLNQCMSQLKDVQFCFLADRYFEITKYATDKGKALEVLCDYLNIDLKNTIAFGDGENDLQFLKKAGVAVAMQNAHDSLKANADMTAKSNNENGVCEIIKELL